MSLTLELPPEVETRLMEEAARRGLSVSEVISLLVQGYFWPAESSLLQEWYRQESRRSLFCFHHLTQVELRERLVEALTQEKYLEAQIARQERDIARCEREAILAAQKGERDEAMKAYQKRVLYEQRRSELIIQLPGVKAEAERLRAELRSRETNVLTSRIDMLRMKLRRNRADSYLAKPAFPHSIEYELETNIRKYASEAAWNAQYEEWIAAHQDAVVAEVPSEAEVMKQAGEQNQQMIDKLIQRLDDLHNAGKPSEQEPPV